MIRTVSLSLSQARSGPPQLSRRQPQSEPVPGPSVGPALGCWVKEGWDALFIFRYDMWLKKILRDRDRDRDRMRENEEPTWVAAPRDTEETQSQAMDRQGPGMVAEKGQTSPEPGAELDSAQSLRKRTKSSKREKYKTILLVIAFAF